MLGGPFTLAFRSGHLPNQPHLSSLRVNDARQGFFADAGAHEFLKQLPEYLQAFVEADYITGWRRGELRDFRWSQVDSETGAKWPERGTTKSGEPRSFRFVTHSRLAQLIREEQPSTSDS